MKVGSGSLLGTTTLLACLLAAPALATPHTKLDKPNKPNADKHALLLSGTHDHGLHLGLLKHLRLDLRDRTHDHRGHRHALVAKLRGPKKQPPVASGAPGAGAVFAGTGTPSGTDVPMPEPGAALLFALGTGLVALYLKRPQTA